MTRKEKPRIKKITNEINESARDEIEEFISPSGLTIEDLNQEEVEEILQLKSQIDFIGELLTNLHTIKHVCFTIKLNLKKP